MASGMASQFKKDGTDLFVIKILLKFEIEDNYLPDF